MHAFTPCFRGLRITKGAFTTPLSGTPCGQSANARVCLAGSRRTAFFSLSSPRTPPVGSPNATRFRWEKRYSIGCDTRASDGRPSSAAGKPDTAQEGMRVGGGEGEVLWSLYRVSCARKQWHTAREALVMYTSFRNVFFPVKNRTRPLNDLDNAGKREEIYGKKKTEQYFQI